MSQEFKYLTSEQRESLRDLPFAVLIPRGLPEGWSVTTLDFDEDEEGASFLLDLVKGGSSVRLLATNEGLGDPPGGGRTSRHKHPELGDLEVSHEEDGDFLSDWVEVENGFCAVGGHKASDQDLDQLIETLVLY